MTNGGGLANGGGRFFLLFLYPLLSYFQAVVIGSPMANQLKGIAIPHKRYAFSSNCQKKSLLIQVILYSFIVPYSNNVYKNSAFSRQITITQSLSL